MKALRNTQPEKCYAKPQFCEIGCAIPFLAAFNLIFMLNTYLRLDSQLERAEWETAF